ncbi:MAG: TRAP transporter small permease subunit [Proteobacteria bacterium]|nr:TRAP transporter small permease subunit [Pseudomonadota bacterium]
MQRFLLLVDEISTWLGKTFAWTILLLTFAICYEVFRRYVLSDPTTWAYDAEYILYGTLFMMAGPYALARNGHVRGDFIYRAFPVRRQAWLDLILYFLFFFPAVLAFILSGWAYFWLSFLTNEHSSASPAGPPIWPFKFLIPFVGCFMFLQGIAEVIRCIQCLKTGEWPQRLHDVEEMEKLILEQAEAAKAKSGASQ